MKQTDISYNMCTKLRDNDFKFSGHAGSFTDNNHVLVMKPSLYELVSLCTYLLKHRDEDFFSLIKQSNGWRAHTKEYTTENNIYPEDAVAELILTIQQDASNHRTT